MVVYVVEHKKNQNTKRFLQATNYLALQHPKWIMNSIIIQLHLVNNYVTIQIIKKKHFITKPMIDKKKNS